MDRAVLYYSPDSPLIDWEEAEWPCPVCRAFMHPHSYASNAWTCRAHPVDAWLIDVHQDSDGWCWKYTGVYLGEEASDG